MLHIYLNDVNLKQRAETVSKLYGILSVSIHVGNSDLVAEFVYDNIIRGIVPKRHHGLESPTVFVLIADNKFDLYNITEIVDKKYQILDRALESIIGSADILSGISFRKFKSSY